MPSEVPPHSDPPVLLLDADAAWTCPVKTHNRFDETVPLPDASGQACGPDPDSLVELFAVPGGARGQLLDRLADWPGAIDLRATDSCAQDSKALRAATVEAVEQLAALIVSPRLPDDPAGHRCGSPDLLVLADDGSGYLPVLLVGHQVLERAGGEHVLRATLLDGPQACATVPGVLLRTSRPSDLLRAAHYWRMLETLGWQAAGAPGAGILGIDRIIAAEPGWTLQRPARGGLIQGGHALIAWADLASPVIRTFARTAESGWRLHSALDRYDHEFAFRLHVAQLAAARHGQPDDPEPGVRPVVVEECASCCWWPACRPSLDENDLSLRIDKARLDAREVSLLRAMGISTIQQLAAVDIDALLPDYLPQVAHRSGGERRLRTAARRATLLSRGETLQRIGAGRIELPTPGWSIDLDIETSVRDRVYLWGFLVDDPADASGPHYVHFARFSLLDEAAEQELAEQAMGWLVEALSTHPGARVYHYSDFELVHIRRIAAASGLPHTTTVAQALAQSAFFDLFSVVRSSFFGTHGLGLKAVASDGAGFRWRDEDPGGLNSQRWFAAAVSATDEQESATLQRRVLQYNEDDTRATRALRSWLRELG